MKVTTIEKQESVYTIEISEKISIKFKSFEMDEKEIFSKLQHDLKIIIQNIDNKIHL